MCICKWRKNSFFSCNIGVRQGENLSPLLFSLYLNDLENFLRLKDINGIDCRSHELDNEIGLFLKILLLLYADDTVLICESAIDLQHSLTAFQGYCTSWKLTVNVNKTKVLIFSKGRNLAGMEFILKWH